MEGGGKRSPDASRRASRCFAETSMPSDLLASAWFRHHDRRVREPGSGARSRPSTSRTVPRRPLSTAWSSIIWRPGSVTRASRSGASHASSSVSCERSSTAESSPTASFASTAMHAAWTVLSLSPGPSDPPLHRTPTRHTDSARLSDHTVNDGSEDDCSRFLRTAATLGIGG